MKALSVLQIRNRISKKFGYNSIRRKLTQKEDYRKFYMEQIIIKMEIKYQNELNKNNIRLIIADNF